MISEIGQLCTNFPSFKIVTASQVTKISSNLCVINITAIFCSFNLLITLNKVSTSEVSRDDVGSSKTTNLDCIEIARAIETICCIAVLICDNFCVTSNSIPIDFKLFSASTWVLFQSILLCFRISLPIKIFSAMLNSGIKSNS